MPTITDNFNRADADALGSSSEGWSWTEVQGDIDIVSNEAKGGAGGANSARAESDLGSADHYAQVSSVVPGDGGGPCVRYAAGAATYYVVYFDGSTRVFKIQSGGLTNIGSVTNYSSGSLKLQVSGTTLEVFDGTGSLGTISDGDITTGTRGGIRLDGTVTRTDNFEAGTLGGGGGGAIPAVVGGRLVGGMLTRGLVN